MTSLTTSLKHYFNLKKVLALSLIIFGTLSIWPISLGTSIAATTVKSNNIKSKSYTPKKRRISTKNHQSPNKFINDILPHAIKAGKKLGVDPKVIMAQAALESNWGRSVPRHADKSSTYNIFGIKYTRGANTKFARVKTTEYIKGRKKSVTARFRAYKNYAQAFDDYTRLMQKPRYQKNIKNI